MNLRFSHLRVDAHVAKPGSRGGHIIGYRKGEPVYGKPGEKLPATRASELVGKTEEPSNAKVTDERLGDCYESAWQELAYGHETDQLAKALGKEPKLVHGYPTATGGAAKGSKIGHAWVEVGPLVLDHGHVIPKEAYYRIAQINPAESRSYTREQAMVQAVKQRIYGPFENTVKEARFRKAQGLSNLSPALEKDLNRLDKKYDPYDSEGRDTSLRFSNPKGEWTRERRRLHDELVAKVLGKDIPAQEHPEFVLMGGGTASGKSTAIRSGQIKLPDQHTLINPDDFKEMLPEFQVLAKHKDTRAAAYTHEESSQLGKRAMREALEARRHVVQDGTGNTSFASVKRKVDAARSQGHKVRAEYATVSVETALARNKARGAKTGRLVPETFVRSVHRSVSNVFPEAVKQGLFDQANLWDTEGSPVLVASAVGTELTVHDQGRWDAFIAKGKI